MRGAISTQFQFFYSVVISVIKNLISTQAKLTQVSVQLKCASLCSIAHNSYKLEPWRKHLPSDMLCVSVCVSVCVTVCVHVYVCVTHMVHLYCDIIESF